MNNFNKSSNLEEIDVLLKGYKPPKLSPEKLDILSLHISVVCVLLDVSGTCGPMDCSLPSSSVCAIL